MFFNRHCFGDYCKQERQRNKLKDKASKKKDKKRSRTGVFEEDDKRQPQPKKVSSVAHIKSSKDGKSDVYKSIFLSSRPQAVEKETFCARSVSARGFSLK